MNDSIPANDETIRDAADGFVRVWSDPDLLAETAQTLTCDEADSLAELFRAFGYDWTAEFLLDVHARSDDGGDKHHDRRPD